jgi:hypothetical protein
MGFDEVYQWRSASRYTSLKSLSFSVISELLAIKN